VFEIKSINSSISQNKMIRDKPDYQCPRFKYSLFIIKSDSESLYCFQLYDSQSLFADKTIKNKHRRQWLLYCLEFTCTYSYKDARALLSTCGNNENVL